jgi:hypothetical protein
MMKRVSAGLAFMDVAKPTIPARKKQDVWPIVLTIATFSTT